MLTVDAILFDMDGTLVDESASYREAIRRTAEYLLNAPVTAAEVEAIKERTGFNNDWDATWALVAWRRWGVPPVPAQIERDSPEYARLQAVFQTFYLGDVLWQELSGQDPPFPWTDPLIARERSLIAPATLTWLRRYSAGIATSRPRVEALLALRQHGLDAAFTPEMVVASEDAIREKPDPAPLLLLAERLGCRHPVYVGDTVNDALAARAAGMPFIQVGYVPLLGVEVHAAVPDVNGIVDLWAEPAA